MGTSYCGAGDEDDDDDEDDVDDDVEDEDAIENRR
jgi:hypothetical protein